MPCVTPLGDDSSESLCLVSSSQSPHVPFPFTDFAFCCCLFFGCINSVMGITSCCNV